VDGNLEQHKKETLFVRVKEENDRPPENCGRRTFGEVFAKYHAKEEWNRIFWPYTGTRNPALAQVRGKIVILQDFTGPCMPDGDGNHIKYGIPFDPSAFYVHGKFEQDWKVPTVFDLYSKWEKVKAHLESAHRDWSKGTQAGRFYVNFISGSGGGCYPWQVSSGHERKDTHAPQLATGLHPTNSVHKWPDFPLEESRGMVYQGMNVLTLQWFRANPKEPYVGFIMMDFPGAEIFQGIIELNFRVVQ
jgi:1-phosphatidylinositol phosphodiesterase